MTFCFQDINDEDCVDQSTLVYNKELKKFIEKIQQQRGVKRPFLTVGLDGGQEKCLLVINIHDLDDPSPTMFKDGGRRRSIIIARGIIVFIF